VRALPKPAEREGRETLTASQRRECKLKHFRKQKGKCCSCGRPMTLEPGWLNTATLGHRNPQPAGCSKDDRPENILGCQCFLCNAKQGSKRVDRS
jgi:hypothetical protein